ncbi:MAG TPA: hypothetical protein HA286_01100 [Candidatus Poseidoniaceae archaeon]|nr:hypothetical protein [Candidatus Poseidoniaceae archaeon]
MFRARVVEAPLPTARRDLDSLVTWFIDAFALVRRSGPASADGGRASPVHRLLREHVLLDQQGAWDAGQLADDLGLAPASLNHHLTRLVETGLLGHTDEGKGWRRYYLHGGSLRTAVERVRINARLVTAQRLQALGAAWTRAGAPLDLDLGEEDPLPLSLGMADLRPPIPESGADAMTLWMADSGLLGDRPGSELKSGSASHRLFLLLLERDAPLSTDEAAEAVDVPAARAGRILERFRSTGVVERVPRTDRLATSLWSAMITQHERRGADWLLLKGGFQRLLSETQQTGLLKPLEKNTLRPEGVSKVMAGLSAQDQMLLLNLLGGRLALGHRMAGSTLDQVQRRVLERLERTFRRIDRVAELIEEVLADVPA